VLHAARSKCRTQKIATCAPSRNIVRLYLRNEGMYRQPEKMLNSNVSSTCTHNMANFGPLTAEIGWRIWSTPSKFQRVSSVGFVTAATSFTGGQPNFARRLAVSWAGTLYIHFQPAGRPSRWASAHIVGLIFNPRDQSKVPGSFWVHVSDGSWPTPLTRDPSSYDDPFDP